MRQSYAWLGGVMLLALSCQRPLVEPMRQDGQAAGTDLTETFETGTKTAYAIANVTLGTGSWSFDDALIGNSASDLKVGTQSARVRNAGKLTMKFDKAGGAGTVSVSHGNYGSDAGGQWQLWYSTNSGSTYTQATGTISSGNTLATASWALNLTGSVRIEIRKTDGGTGRINIDNVSITDYAGVVAPTLTSISPSSCTAGAGTFTLTANGTGFTSTSIIKWNGSALSTTYVSASQLTASVSSTLLAAAGTATVTVTNAAGTSAGLNFTINTATTTGKRFLFDNTSAQTAGNADWVIDEDGSTAARYPTPAQSGITSSTAESYWTGALSSWGIALVKAGHSVQTLPSSGSITFGNSSNTQDLSNYDVFIIDEPNIRFTAAEKTAMLQFVQAGGGLVMISDHNVSDRNNDGWDSPAIWNDFFTNNGTVSNPFGISVDLNNLVGTTANRLAATTNPILNGIAGTVGTIEYNNGASMTLNTTANPNVKGLIWKSGSTQNNSNVWAASSTYGTGRVFMIGDSSPMDDGSGASGNTLFPGWTDYTHKQLMLNASYWCAKAQ